jgi:hypothetical protein
MAADFIEKGLTGYDTCYAVFTKKKLSYAATAVIWK